MKKTTKKKKNYQSTDKVLKKLAAGEVASAVDINLLTRVLAQRLEARERHGYNLALAKQKLRNRDKRIAELKAEIKGLKADLADAKESVKAPLALREDVPPGFKRVRRRMQTVTLTPAARALVRTVERRRIAGAAGEIDLSEEDLRYIDYSRANCTGLL